MEYNIQIINASGKNTYGKSIKCIKPLGEPRSLDEFDINIIDLSDKELWVNNGNSKNSINIYKDLLSLKSMIQRCEKTKIIIILPQNIDYRYYYKFVGRNDFKSFSESCKLKDMIKEMQEIINCACPINLMGIVYENTHTTINGEVVPASFFFSSGKSILSSDESIKTVAILLNDYYLTTLDLNTDVRIISFLDKIGITNSCQECPEWFDSIHMFDDLEQNKKIEKAIKIIDDNNAIIAESKSALSINRRWKSILYSSGNELVKVIFEMLEDMLDIDLSGFKDVNKDDFRFFINDTVFIGEIKGIGTNVKSNNVSQLDNHVQDYRDEQDDYEGAIVALLIINYLRERAPQERDPVHETQIKLAERNGSLIIDSYSFLKLYEKYKKGLLSKKKIIAELTTQKGLFIVP